MPSSNTRKMEKIAQTVPFLSFIHWGPLIAKLATPSACGNDLTSRMGPAHHGHRGRAGL